MNSVLCFFVLFTGYSLGQNLQLLNPGMLTNLAGNLLQNITVLNITINATTIENFERPCPVYDTYCIRQYFANNAKCKVAYGPVPEPYYRAQSTSYISSANITTTLTNIELKGLNGRIEEFYVNRETDNLVMTIEFRGLSINSSYAYFRFHRRSREPVVTGDTYSVVYQSVVTTIIIPNSRNLQLDQSEVFAYVNDVNPTYTLGPGISNSLEPQVSNALNALNANSSLISRESFLTDGSFYPATFIQWNICDFGMKLL